MSTLKIMGHAAYLRKVKKMSNHELQHVAQDCQNAIDAMPENPNVGYYTDERLYCLQELSRRYKIKFPSLLRLKPNGFILKGTGSEVYSIQRSKDFPWTLVRWEGGWPEEVLENNFLQGFISDLSAYFGSEKLADIMEKTS